MLTMRLKKCLDYIEGYQAAHSGTSPSYGEILVVMGGAHKSQVHYLLVRLEERGFVRRIPRRARAIEVLRRSVPVVRYPDASYFVVERVDEKAVLVPLGKANAP